MPSTPEQREKRRVYMRKWNAANPEKVRASRRKKYERTKDRVLAYAAEWRRRNPDRVRASREKWVRANPRRDVETKRAWYERNADKAKAGAAARYAADPERAAALGDRWRKANPEKVATYRHTRRALVRNAPGRGVTHEEWLGVVRQSGGLCAYCGGRPERLVMDHIEPLIGGGAHDLDNIAAVCHGCNSSKSATPLLVWLAKRALARDNLKVA